MTDELFATEESLSPRLRWMRGHRIQLQPDAYDEFEDEWRNFLAFVPYENQAFGDTEDEALVNLAIKLGIPDWRQQA